jgi:hypothetical protein
MYSTPKGFLPLALHYAGGLLIGCSFIVILFSVGTSIYRGPLVATDLVALVVVFAGLMVFGVGLTAVFPTIRLTDKGISYRHLEFLGGDILWEEVVGLFEVKWPRNCYAIVIDRKGLGLIGLYFNSIYGFVGGYDAPVLLLHSSLEGMSKIREEIIARSPRLSTKRLTS